MEGRGGIERPLKTPYLAILDAAGLVNRQQHNVIRAGAHGYLNRAGAPQEALTAVRKILLAGETYWSETLNKLAMMEGGTAGDGADLSARELQVDLSPRFVPVGSKNSTEVFGPAN